MSKNLRYGPQDMAVDSVEELGIENEKWLQKMKSLNMSYHTLAAPLYEVFSVKLHCNSFSIRQTCEVYGNISIEDEYGSSYDLYSREPDDAETVTPEDNSLSVYMSDECALSNTWVRMSLTLKDKADDAVIVDEVLVLDNVTKEDEYDQVKIQHVRGVGGYASVSYAALSAAVLALVEITLIIDDHENSALFPTATTADVYGRIVARYGNTYGKRYPEIVLLKNPTSQPTRMESQLPIELSRDVVSVPAYSFLRVEVDLSDSRTNQHVLLGKAEFLARHRNNFTEDIKGEDFVLRVNVEWIHPYIVENQDEKPLKLKRPKLSMDQQPGRALRMGSVPFLRKNEHEPMGFNLVEVFGVMIGHNSESVLNICGTMTIRDSLVECFLFNRSESNPETLTPNSKTIPTDGPSQCFDGPEGLAMQLNLWDVQGCLEIKGNITWGIQSIGVDISWYDRRLCSVIRGMHGYAAVFYSIFSRAVQALVKVSFIANGSPDVSHVVNGSIRARYSNHVCATEYERAYYQSVLFKGREDLKSGYALPLLKSVVAVPKYASLIVEVDLHASSLLNGFPEENLKEITEFVNDPNAESRVDPDTCIRGVAQGARRTETMRGFGSEAQGARRR